MANRVEKTFCKGEVIIKEGHSGNTFYVILEGMVEVLKRREDKNVSLNVLGPGEFFGEMSLINPEQPKRSATVRALEDTRVAIMTKEDFAKYLGTLTPGVKNLLNKLSLRLRTTNEKVALKKDDPVASENSTLDYTLTLDELEKARAHAVDINFINKKFRKGQTILREGEPGQCGFIVKKGSLEVSRMTDKGKVVLTILNEHDILGENAMFEEASRSATVRALTDGELMVFGKRDMLTMARQSPLELFMIMDSMSSKMESTNEKYCQTIIELNRTREELEKLQARIAELEQELESVRNPKNNLSQNDTAENN